MPNSTCISMYKLYTTRDSKDYTIYVQYSIILYTKRMKSTS